jgi:hypothetical protein
MNKLDIIDEIEIIRQKNNMHWMDLVRLAFRLDEKQATDIMRKITECDGQINELTKELGK